MTAVLLLHHPEDSHQAEHVAVGLADQIAAVRCRVALPREEALRRCTPAPDFEIGGAMLFALTLRFQETDWFEYLDRVCPSPLDPVLISLLFEEAPIPRLLQDKAAIDLRPGEPRNAALGLLHELLRSPRSPAAVPEILHDEGAEERGLVGSYYLRPKQWYCVYCGSRCEDPNDDTLCGRCGKLRPFAGGSCTMIQCGTCCHFSIAAATFCEWCGRSF